MAESKKAPMPTGRKKGGAMFPRIPLAKGVEYSQRLVSKTHIGPQPASVILPGVFRAGGSRGAVRASALKQFGLLEGSSSEYTATQLAKSIAAAPEGERAWLHREACLRPRVFRNLYDTFHGDEVALGRLRQQAADSKVHPDELDNCVEMFVASAVFSGLGKQEGDMLRLIPASDVNVQTAANGSDRKNEEATSEEESAEDVGGDEEHTDEREPSAASKTDRASVRSVVQVNVTIDSTMDTEKLERQLSLLRRFGAI
jgi:hypothetical protein